MAEEKRTTSYDEDLKTTDTPPVLSSDDILSDAIDGENREHGMTILQGVRRYPKACFWAFLMCFTIVSY